MTRALITRIAWEHLVNDPEALSRYMAEKIIRKATEEQLAAPWLIIVEQPSLDDDMIAVKIYGSFQPGGRWTPISVLTGVLRRFARRIK